MVKSSPCRIYEFYVGLPFPWAHDYFFVCNKNNRPSSALRGKRKKKEEREKGRKEKENPSPALDNASGCFSSSFSYFLLASRLFISFYLYSRFRILQNEKRRVFGPKFSPLFKIEPRLRLASLLKVRLKDQLDRIDHLDAEAARMSEELSAPDNQGRSLRERIQLTFCFRLLATSVTKRRF